MKRYQTLIVFCMYCLPSVHTQAQPGAAGNPFRAYTSTQYTEHTELFAEYRPLLAGTPARFTAHLTNLGEVFTPCTDAEVTLTLAMNGKSVWMQTLDRSISQGVYRFPINISQTGIGVVTIALKRAGYTDKFTIDSVVVFKDTAAALAAQLRRPVEHKTGELGYTKEKSWLEPFATAVVTIRKKMVMVPASAVLTAGSEHFVVMQEDPEHFRRHPVKMGKKDGEWVEIKGIEPGTRVVIKGAEKI